MNKARAARPFALLFLAFAAAQRTPLSRLAAEESGEHAGTLAILSGSVSTLGFAALDTTNESHEWTSGGRGTLEATLRAASGVVRAEASFELTALSGAAARDAWSALTLVAQAEAPADDILFGPVFDTESPPPPPLVAARLRTLHASLRLGAFKATLGRQVLNFGKGALYSPVDLFSAAEYSPFSIIRRGTDALRLSASLGPLALAEAVAAPAADLRDGRYAICISGFALGVDGSLIGAWKGDARNGDSLVAGGDAKVDLPFAAIYIDTTYSIPCAEGETFDLEAGDLCATIGFDASRGVFVMQGEYCYNAAPSPGTPRHGVYAKIAYGLSPYATIALSAAGDAELFSGRGGLIASYEIEQGTTVTASLTADRKTALGEGLAISLGIGCTVNF